MKAPRILALIIIVLLVTAFSGWAQKQVSASDLKIWVTPSAYQKATGKAIAKYSEAPLLAQMVANKTLPALKDRLPDEPLVVGTAEEIGKFGGSLTAQATSKASWDDVVLSFLLDDAMILSNDTSQILPGWATSWALSSDKRTLTLKFRKGMKWSDGVPFTVDDVLFWWQDDMSNPKVTPSIWPQWMSGGEPLAFVKVDDLTLQIKSKDPYPSLPFLLAQYYSQQARMFEPKHYLQKWHATYNAQADDLAKQEGFDDWSKAFNFHKQFEPFPNDESLPTISAWRLTKMGTTEATYERNPYYWKVDTAGNQLPYIDKVVVLLVPQPETITMKAIAGDYDFICLDLSLKNWPVYQANQDKGGYRLLNWSSTEGNQAAFTFNLNHKDPVLKKLFNDVRWRQAMSLAIDRKAINDTLFFGLAVPRQTSVIPATTFFKQAWADSYAKLDVKQANTLLDQLGLAKRDTDGFRLRPDGKTLAIVLNVNNTADYLSISEMVAEFWNKVGVKTTVKEMDFNLFFTRRDAADFDVDVWHLGLAMEGSLYANPDRWAPYGGENRPGPLWGLWFDTKGKSGEEPPPVVKQIKTWIDQWKTISQSDPQYKVVAQRIYDNYAQNLWSIGTLGLVRQPVIIKKNLANVPSAGYHGNDQGFARTFAPWQWFFR